ncbi:MAG: ABC transporter permease [Lachnospiraceae bacterium]|jgi:putative ABC transport system permease protein|nr:ABC transporter permease [Lachnospiraceae bacterium]MDD7702471.1 ABC transporter permease [Lachnospiraceae bacterium]MEE3433521.1 ABC transporter permease [Lachnospiraceae bacterium]
MALVISVFEQGFIYAVMALGIYITYKILDFPDLTVDGSFPMGAAIAAIMITKGIPAIITLPVAFLAGGLAGLITGLIHVKLHVRDLLSGIIVMTALYSVNLWIMGKANIPLYNNETIFDNGIVNSIFVGPLADFATSIILLVIVLVVKLILDWYLRTKSGFMLRAVGSNARLVTSMGINKGKIKIIGLVIANGLCTLGGCLYAQEQRYADVSMGTGTMVIGLASVIIGTTLFRKVNFMSVTTSVVIGSVLYKACVAVAVHFLRNANDLKLITSVLFLIILVVSMDKKRKVASEDA